MKTAEELSALKSEVETLNKKLAELNEEELAQVTGGDVTSANIVGYSISYFDEAAPSPSRKRDEYDLTPPKPNV